MVGVLLLNMYDPSTIIGGGVLLGIKCDYVCCSIGMYLRGYACWTNGVAVVGLMLP